MFRFICSWALSLLILCAATVQAADSKKPDQGIQLPEFFQKKIIEQLKQEGEVILGRSDSRVESYHGTNCVAAGGFQLTFYKEGGWNSTETFSVGVWRADRSESVEDAKIHLQERNIGEDTNVETAWGRGGPTKTTIKTFFAKFDVESVEKKHQLGHRISGCIPQPLYRVTVHAVCHDAKTVWERPEPVR